MWKRFCRYGDYMTGAGVTMVTVPCRWSVPMMMSITHRGTGVGLSAGNTCMHTYKLSSNQYDRKYFILLVTLMNYNSIKKILPDFTLPECVKYVLYVENGCYRLAYFKYRKDIFSKHLFN